MIGCFMNKWKGRGEEWKVDSTGWVDGRTGGWGMAACCLIECKEKGRLDRFGLNPASGTN